MNHDAIRMECAEAKACPQLEAGKIADAIRMECAEAKAGGGRGWEKKFGCNPHGVR